MFVLGDGNPLVHIRAPYVNRSIIVACIVVFAGQAAGLIGVHYAFVPASLFGGGSLFGLAGGGGGPASLVTHQFMHVGPLHLGGNMLMLWVFGDNIEDAVGHIRYLAFYLLSGIAGALAYGLFIQDPLAPMAGASGAISGVMGAYLLLHPRARVLVALFWRVPMALPAGLVVGFYLLTNLIMVIAGPAGPMDEPVAWWAHVGGYGAGMALITRLRKPDVPLFQPATAYPVDPFPRLRQFASRFGLGALFAGTHPHSPGGGRLGVLIRSAIFLLVTGMVFGFF